MLQQAPDHRDAEHEPADDQSRRVRASEHPERQKLGGDELAS
jgi:hypothetical protein